MKPNHTVAIFGASGGTGRRVVEAVIKHGGRVHALVRSTATPWDETAQVDVWYEDFSSAETLSSVVKGADAVCCLFGPRPPYTEVFCAEATRAVVEAMKQHGVRRLICQTGAMIGEYQPNRSLGFQCMVRAFEQRLPAVAADRREQEGVVRSSGLDWTLVKPPRLTDGPRTGRIQVGADVRVGLLSKISRSDLADIIVGEIEQSRFIGEAIFATER